MSACSDGKGSLASLFFSEQVDDISLAKRICSVCPILSPCFEGALARREPCGVWGGEVFTNGRVQRKRGRPRKNPAPDLAAAS